MVFNAGVMKLFSPGFFSLFFRFSAYHASRDLGPADCGLGGKPTIAGNCTAAGRPARR
jgi:hypothetical protein